MAAGRFCTLMTPQPLLRLPSSAGRPAFTTSSMTSRPRARMAAGARGDAGREAAAAHPDMAGPHRGGRAHRDADDRRARGVERQGQARSVMAAKTCLVAPRLRRGSVAALMVGHGRNPVESHATVPLSGAGLFVPLEMQL